MLALGHNSKAVARAYAKKARVEIPALEDFEEQKAATDLQDHPDATGTSAR